MVSWIGKSLLSFDHPFICYLFLYGRRASLPAKFQLSQTEDGARRLHPSTATLLAEYDAYIIQLLRPYLTIGIGDGAQIDAFEFCIFAADEAINLIRHIKDHYGGRKAPLCLQM